MRFSWVGIFLMIGSWGMGATIQYVGFNKKTDPAVPPITFSEIICTWDKNTLEVNAYLGDDSTPKLTARLSLSDPKTPVTLEMDSSVKDTPVLKFTDSLDEIWTSEFDNDPKSTWSARTNIKGGKLLIWISSTDMKVEANPRFGGLLSFVTVEKSPFICDLPKAK